MVELLVVMVLTTILMIGIVNVFVSGSRAGADANVRLDSQQSTRLALDQIEFQSRCATSVGLLSSGAGVAFSLPPQCTHGSGDVSWCVADGVLTSYASASCAGTGTPYVRGITSSTPFALASNAGDLPQLLVTITADANQNTADGATLEDTITLRNAGVVTS
jgi:Tfp pilus assembly protein PilW